MSHEAVNESNKVGNLKVMATSKNDADHTFKIVIIGESGTGKTALLQRFTEEKYDAKYLATIGVDFAVRTIEMQKKRLRLMIWDTCGSERYHTIALTYYRSASGILLVYEMGNRASLKALEFWLEEAEAKTNASSSASSYTSKTSHTSTSFANTTGSVYSGRSMIVLVGSKADKANEASEADKADSAAEVTQVTLAADLFAQKYGIPHVQCSAKTDTNVNEVFGTLCQELLKEIDLMRVTSAAASTSDKTTTSKNGKVVELISPSTTKSGKCCK